MYDRILEALHIRLDADGEIDWDLWCIDGSSVRAAQAAAGAANSDSGSRCRTAPRSPRWLITCGSPPKSSPASKHLRTADSVKPSSRPLSRRETLRGGSAPRWPP